MTRLIERTKAVLALVLVTTVGSCGRSGTAGTVAGDALRIELVRIPDTATSSVRAGLTNIFFTGSTGGLAHVPRLAPEWRDVEYADVVKADGLGSIHAARFRMRGDTALQYVVDTTGTLDFAHGVPLRFRREGALRIAEVELDVRSTAGRRVRLPYQILVNDDGYSYARIAEFRAGRLQLGGRAIEVRVRPRSRNRPFYDLGSGTLILADLDGDGAINEQIVALSGGRPASSEQLTSGFPFVLEGQAFEFSSIDSAGTRLELRPSRIRVAAIEGFRAPPFQAEGLDGGRIRFEPSQAGPTLIQFWATDCVFSERVRPAVNALASSLRDTRFQWIAVAKDQDRAAVKKHLETHPMHGTVVFADSASWASYNREVSTPLFVLVDGQGIVRHRAVGASTVSTVAEKVRALVGHSSP